MKKLRKSFISSVLAFSVFASSILPYTQALAVTEPMTGPKISAPMVDIPKGKPDKFPLKAKTEVELKQRKTANQKLFLMPNGDFKQEIYAQPVHWKNTAGVWEDIDNNIVLANEENIDLPFRNASNNIVVRFAKELKGQAVQKIEYKGKSIESRLLNALPSMGLPKENKISYANVLPAIDINYTLNALGVKEDILLQNKSASNQISYELSTNGLTPKLNTDKTISFLNDKGKVIIRTAKLYALDKNNEMTEKIDVSLRPVNNKWILDIVVDKAWLDDANRSYPVIVDPSFTVDDTNGDVLDGFVAQNYPNNNYSTQTWLDVGYNSFGNNESLLYFNLPNLYSSTEIVTATLKLDSFTNDATPTQIDVHQITSPWQSNTVTWNTRPTVGSTPVATQSSITIGYWNFDVTNVVKNWVKGDDAALGFLLKSPGATNKRAFYSSESPTSVAPKLEIIYKVDPIGAEDYWSFDKSTNIFNGNLLLSDTDASLNGKGIPINVVRTYNSRAEAGKEWVFNTDMHLKFNKPLDSKYLVFVDEDGTEHPFEYKDSTWNPPPGKYFTLTHSTIDEYFELTDKGQNIYHFNGTSGKLQKITDPNNNTLTYTYNTDGTLDKITDASNRYITYNYVNGKLDNITGNEIPKVKYTYDTNGRLSKVEKLGATNNVLTKVSYEYDSNGNVNVIKDGKDYPTSIAYTTDDKVQEISNIISNGTVTLSSSYTYEATGDAFNVTVTNPKGIDTRYSTNSVGNITQIIDNYGGASTRTAQFTWDQNQLLTDFTNPRLKKTTLTYGKNGNLEQVTNPKQYNNTMKYDANNNVTQETGLSGETSTNGYDTTLNNTNNTSSNSAGGINEFDTSGNVTKTTADISLATNLILNGGFEDWGTLPDKWDKVGTTGTITSSTLYVNGSSSVKLSSTSMSDTATIRSVYIPVKGNTNYNLSWYIDTYYPYTADVKVEWYADNTGSNPIQTTSGLNNSQGGYNGWIRKGEQLISPVDATYAKIILTTANGSAWFDNIQLEEGSFINEYNVLVNESMEIDNNTDGKADSWTMGSVYNTANDGIDTTKANSGNNSIKIVGSADEKFFGQPVKIAGKKGSSLTFSGYSYTNGLNPAGGDYVLQFRLDYLDGTYGWFSKSFDKTQTGVWQQVESTINADKDYKSYAVFTKLQNQTGTAWFDDIQVRATSMENAMVSEFNLAQNSSFEYVEDGNATYGWSVSIEPDKTATITRETIIDNVYIGDAGIKVTDSVGWAVFSNNRSEPLRTGKTYTASAMIKTEGVTSGGGYLKIELLNGSGVDIKDYESKVITGDSDWQRVFVSMTEAEAKQFSASAASVRVSFSTKSNTTGTVYFDAVRFEANSITSSATYNSNGYLTSAKDPMGNETTNEVDNRGNVTKTTFPITSSYMESAYDELDRIVTSSDMTDLKVQYLRDANGNVTEVDYIDKTSGQIVSKVLQDYNELNQSTNATDQNGKLTVFTYDEDGNSKDVIYPNGKGIHFTYDAFDQITGVSYTGDNTTWAYQYDANGNMTKVTKNGSDVTDYGYDPDLDQVKDITYPAVNGTRNKTTFAYDQSDRVTSITNSLVSGATIHEYYQSGQAARTTGANNQTSSNMYDEQGRIKRITTNDGTKTYHTYFEYNENGLLSKERLEANGGAILYNDQFTYNANGKNTQIRYKDGSKVQYSYDAANQLTDEKYLSTSGSIITETSYTYDMFGNRKTMTKDGATTNYAYDLANQLITAGTINYQYDDNGNQTSDGTKTYVYNAENQLITVKDANDNVVASYEYDHTGKRSKKTANGKTEMYYYIGDNLAYITDQNNNLRYSFTRDASGQLLTFTDHTGATPTNYFYVLNNHGDVIGLRNSSGNLVVSYNYDAFGNIISSTGTATTGDGKLLKEENPFRYAGYFYDEETDYYYLQARYYDAGTGRFTSRDPVDNVNLYYYCDNDPVNYFDPSGNYYDPVSHKFKEDKVWQMVIYNRKFKLTKWDALKFMGPYIFAGASISAIPGVGQFKAAVLSIAWFFGCGELGLPYLTSGDIGYVYAFRKHTYGYIGGVKQKITLRIISYTFYDKNMNYKAGLNVTTSELGWRI